MIEDLFPFVIFFILPAVIGIFLGKSMYGRKKRNPKRGAIIGAIIGLFTSYFGLCIFYLIIVRWKNYKSYSLYYGGPKLLVVSWAYGFKHVEIEYDGKVIGVIKSKNDARKGQSFIMPDGALLFFTTQFEINQVVPKLTINEKPIPDCPGDPYYEYKSMTNVFIATGLVNVILIVFLNFMPILAIISFIFGIVGIFIGLFMRKLSKRAIKVGSIYFTIGIIFSVLMFFYTAEVSITPIDVASNFSDLIKAILFVVGLRKATQIRDYLIKEGVTKIT
jgi:hypothetical protein